MLLRNARKATPLLEFCRDACGVTLGIGLMREADDAFRIAHMGHLNTPMMLGVLSCLELALATRGYATGAGGIATAVGYLAGEL